MADQDGGTLKPIALMPGEGTPFEGVGVAMRFLAQGKDTGGKWAFMEYRADPHFRGPAPHYHKVLHEACYILEGALTITVNGQTTVIPTGGFSFFPPGAVHTFSNPSDESMRMLVLLMPGGFEDYFVELADLIKSEPVWPPADMTKLMILMEKYDTFPAPRT